MINLVPFFFLFFLFTKKFLVYKKPVTAVLSTGNEVVDVGETLEPGQIRDSNRAALKAALKEHDFPFVDLGIAKDE